MKSATAKIQTRLHALARELGRAETVDRRRAFAEGVATNVDEFVEGRFRKIDAALDLVIREVAAEERRRGRSLWFGEVNHSIDRLLAALDNAEAERVDTGRETGT